jgi:hypothetical protein
MLVSLDIDFWVNVGARSAFDLSLREQCEPEETVCEQQWLQTRAL